MQERHWLGRALFAVFGSAFMLGAAYLLNLPIALGLVLWAILGTASVVVLEQAHRHWPTQFLRNLADRSPIRVEMRIRRRVKVMRPVTEQGFLDYEKQYYSALVALTKTVQGITKELEDHAPRLTARAQLMQQLQGASVDARLRNATVTARIINDHAARIERYEAPYREQSHAVGVNLVDLFQTMPIEQPEFTASIRRLRDSTAESRAHTSDYRQSARGLRDLRTSGAINEATERLTAVLDRLLQDADEVVQACDDALTVAGNRWPHPPDQGEAPAASTP